MGSDTQRLVFRDTIVSNDRHRINWIRLSFKLSSERELLESDSAAMRTSVTSTGGVKFSQLFS